MQWLHRPSCVVEQTCPLTCSLLLFATTLAGNDAVHAAFEVVEVEIERDVSLGDLHELVCLADPGSYRSISEVVDKDATGGLHPTAAGHHLRPPAPLPS